MVETITKCTTNSASHRFVLAYLPKLKSINIGNNCWTATNIFELSNLDLLESVVIGKDSFSGEQSGSSYQIMNCPILKSIKMGDDSFTNYQSFELNNLPSLQSIDIGANGFYYAPFSLTGMID